jgi:hypothetical protein
MKCRKQNCNTLKIVAIIQCIDALLTDVRGVYLSLWKNSGFSNY